MQLNQQNLVIKVAGFPEKKTVILARIRRHPRSKRGARKTRVIRSLKVDVFLLLF